MTDQALRAVVNLNFSQLVASTCLSSDEDFSDLLYDFVARSDQEVIIGVLATAMGAILGFMQSKRAHTGKEFEEQLVELQTWLG